MPMKLEIVARLRRIVDKAQTGIPPVGVETLLEAADKIECLQAELLTKENALKAYDRMLMK